MKNKNDNHLGLWGRKEAPGFGEAIFAVLFRFVFSGLVFYSGLKVVQFLDKL